MKSSTAADDIEQLQVGPATPVRADRRSTADGHRSPATTAILYEDRNQAGWPANHFVRDLGPAGIRPYQTVRSCAAVWSP
jgi:hypothetical protein